jgi:hypothetical protein
MCVSVTVQVSLIRKILIFFSIFNVTFKSTVLILFEGTNSLELGLYNVQGGQTLRTILPIGAEDFEINNKSPSRMRISKPLSDQSGSFT